MQMRFQVVGNFWYKSCYNKYSIFMKFYDYWVGTGSLVPFWSLSLSPTHTHTHTHFISVYIYQFIYLGQFGCRQKWRFGEMKDLMDGTVSPQLWNFRANGGLYIHSAVDLIVPSVQTYLWATGSFELSTGLCLDSWIQSLLSVQQIQNAFGHMDCWFVKRLFIMA